MSDATPEAALIEVVRLLRELNRGFALVGGLAVSLRAEVRFTRDIDIAVLVESDGEFEQLVFSLRHRGYSAITSVEHTTRARLATVRMESPSGIVVDLIGSTCGIEGEIVARATVLEVPDVGEVPVARAEELLAMKVLSMSERRPQDRTDAINLILFNDSLDLEAVRDNVRSIIERGFHREAPLLDRLDEVLRAARSVR